ncbi:putative rhamnosyl transferase [Sagittula salina]|uniref:Rhamnosyl transferase n=1 Tax=Sagittula salina TaxID=2820268 RepID=A0A940S1V6_9RHOB|nr:putative rhamnosyl transferase [Sagittula salina]MBP0483467.1 putative rhamnosyl transferase [Sagittula salina]
MQTIGFCRFSYPAEGGFQVEHATLPERLAYLYAPERLAERFRHFETICLPSIRAQTDPDFTFIVLTGSSLPEPWATRLRTLLADVPQARLVAKESGPHRKVCQMTINAARDMTQPCLQFRHDDDDAIALTFVETLKQAARDVAPLLDRHRLVGFDWNRGYVARPDTDGLCGELQVTPFWGVAQAVYVQAGNRQSIMNFGHQKLPHFMPCLSYTDTVMYLRGHNDFNDSRQKAHVRPARLPRIDTEGEAELRRLFNIDADQVRAAFS